MARIPPGITGTGHGAVLESPLQGLDSLRQRAVLVKLAVQRAHRWVVWGQRLEVAEQGVPLVAPADRVEVQDHQRVGANRVG